MKVTIEQIQITVATFFNLPLEEITLYSKKRVLALPRPIAMFLARQFTNASLREIAQQFDCKSYKIVRSSIARIDEQRRTDAALNRSLLGLSESLKPMHETSRIGDIAKSSSGADRRNDSWYTPVVGSSRRTATEGTITSR
jgi:Bacterial dnaA protein helix-turn-helix